jgi:hypothetical protein
MKTFIADIFSKLQNYSQKLDNLTLLTNQHWVSIDEITSSKTVYVFRSNNELLISTNGRVEKAKWDYLGNRSLLIDKADESYLFKHGFFDENILALKVDSKNEYAVFVNENKYDGDLNSLEKVLNFLNINYLEPTLKANIKNSTSHKFKDKHKADFDAPLKEKVEIDENPDKDAIFANGIIIIVIVIAVLAMSYLME